MEHHTPKVYVSREGSDYHWGVGLIDTYPITGLHAKPTKTLSPRRCSCPCILSREKVPSLTRTGERLSTEVARAVIITCNYQIILGVNCKRCGTRTGAAK